MDRGAWKATVHGITKSWTRLSNIFTDTIWMHLKNIILSERHQTQRPHVQFHLREMSRIGKSTETESRLVVARDKEDEGMGRSCLMGIQGFILG